VVSLIKTTTNLIVFLLTWLSDYFIISLLFLYKLFKPAITPLSRDSYAEL